MSAAEVDIEAKNVTVTYDDAAVSRSDIVSTMEDQGYDVPEGR